MIVDLVFDAGIAFGVGAGLAFEDDRSAVGHDQSIQTREARATGRTRLLQASYWPEIRRAPDAAGNQQKFPGRRVVDILRHLRRDLARRQIGTQARSRARNAPGMTEPGCKHIGGLAGSLDAIGAHGAAIDISVQERELVILRGEIARTVRLAAAAGERPGQVSGAAKTMRG